MTIDLSLIGMGVIILSWILQIFFTVKGQQAMRRCFAGLQFLGIALLVVATYMRFGTMNALAWMNSVSSSLALVMMILVLKK
ncbi:MAG: hypothetical protein PHP74_03840 [Candidatus Gracilibacteria bacterium]|nr:hypothetical protein [Candidatus Gracilibacteria bacterium]